MYTIALEKWAIGLVLEIVYLMNLFLNQPFYGQLLSTHLTKNMIKSDEFPKFGGKIENSPLKSPRIRQMSRFSLGFSKLTSRKNGETPSSSGTEPVNCDRYVPMIFLSDDWNHGETTSLKSPPMTYSYIWMINFLTISICQEEAIYKKESFIHFQGTKIAVSFRWGRCRSSIFPMASATRLRSLRVDGDFFQLEAAVIARIRTWTTAPRRTRDRT